MKKSRYIPVLLVLTTLLLSGTTVSASGGKVSFVWGGEWSYVASLSEWQHRVFIISEGARMTKRGSVTKYHTNAEILAYAGAGFGKHFTLAFCSGYTGVSENLRMVPFTFRGTWRFGEHEKRQMPFIYLDCGTGVTLEESPSACWCSRAGIGWGIPLSKKSKLDITASFRSIYCHPEFKDDAGRPPIEIRRNNFWRGGVTLGIGLKF
ncbi:MAG: hypothetical protein ACI3ZN_02795 [Candidatus Cryptobacteroides sp.]